jgi:hypothetical protein
VQLHLLSIDRKAAPFSRQPHGILRAHGILKEKKAERPAESQQVIPPAAGQIDGGIGLYYFFKHNRFEWQHTLPNHRLLRQFLGIILGVDIENAEMMGDQAVVHKSDERAEDQTIEKSETKVGHERSKKGSERSFWHQIHIVEKQEKERRRESHGETERYGD